jgi:hypothetical protein
MSSGTAEEVIAGTFRAGTSYQEHVINVQLQILLPVTGVIRRSGVNNFAKNR